MDILHLIEFAFTVLTGWTLGAMVLPRISLVSFRRRLFDSVDGRKLHTAHIPRLGGIAFFPCITITVSLVIIGHNQWMGSNMLDVDLTNRLLSVFCGLFLLYLTGMMDDLIGVRYRSKFLIQILCGILLVASGLCFDNLYGLFGIEAMPYYIGAPFTVFIIVYILNAINLIDGIDGLASGLSSVALLVFTFLFISKGLWSYAMLSAGTFGVLVPFFYYNVFGSVERARKIFMGDTGSLTLGYTLSFLAIKYSQHNTDIMPYTEGAFLIAFSTLIIPAFDVVRVVLVRIREGHSPFEPDKNHIHHKLLAIGLSPRRAMLSLLSMSCAFSAANILLVPYINNTVLLIADIVIWVGLNLWWDYLRDRKR